MQQLHVMYYTLPITYKKTSVLESLLPCWLSVKGCVRYIFASLFLGLNETTCQMKKNFLSWENQILEFRIFKFHDVIKYLGIKQEMHFTE